jgi:hypothetical protein
VNSTWPPVGGSDVTIIFVRPAMAAETIANGKQETTGHQYPDGHNEKHQFEIA